MIIRSAPIKMLDDNFRTIRKAYKVELKLTKEQIIIFEKYSKISRYIFNWGLSERIKKYKEEKKGLSYFDQNKALTELKRNELWLYEPPATILLNALKNVDYAFSNFFRRLKDPNEKNKGFPKFKSIYKGLIPFGFRINMDTIHIEKDKIKLPKIGWINLKEKGYIPNNCKKKNVTVSEKAGKWFVSVQVEEIIENKRSEGEVIGIDVGIKSSAVCSTGEVFDNLKSLYKNERKLKRLHRELSRRKKGGKNREKTKKKLAKACVKVSNIRKDNTHKCSTNIVKNNPSVLVIEDLNIKGMVKNHCLANAIHDANMGELHRQLKYKSDWNGIEVLVADKWFPSSKLCSECGWYNKNLKLSHRVYKCEHCGLVIDRDYNASLNLKQYPSRFIEDKNYKGLKKDPSRFIKDVSRSYPIRDYLAKELSN